MGGYLPWSFEAYADQDMYRIQDLTACCRQNIERLNLLLDIGRRKGLIFDAHQLSGSCRWESQAGI
jgi:hypothetical protein